jgi:FIMAH domain
MNLPHARRQHLVSKLGEAGDSVSRGNGAAAFNQLNAFINEANAQSGEATSASQAATLLSAAQAIMASLS